MSLTGPDTDGWLAGRRPGGIDYGVDEHVVIRTGPGCGRTGTVVMLIDLEPEPRYLVEIGAGHYVQARQSDLGHGD